MMGERRATDNAKQAQEYWDQRYGRSVNDEELRNIESNLVGAFSLLLKWRNAEKTAPRCQRDRLVRP